MNKPDDSTQPAAPRDVPPLPGGGSWTFDDIQWKWISNDPVPVEDVPAAEPAEVASEVPFTTEE